MTNLQERVSGELLANVEACKCFVNVLMQLHAHPNTIPNFNQLQIPELTCKALQVCFPISQIYTHLIFSTMQDPKFTKRISFSIG